MIVVVFFVDRFDVLGAMLFVGWGSALGEEKEGHFIF